MTDKKKSTPTTKYVGFRLPISEYDKFDKKAERSNRTLIDYLRDAILSDKTIIVAKEKKASADKKKMIYLYNKTSNNLNQLARRANTSNQAGTLSEAKYDAILNELLMIRLLLHEGIDDAS